MRILVATDLTENSRFAFERGCRMVESNPGSVLRIVHVLPSSGLGEERLAASRQLREMVAKELGADTCDESYVSIRLPRDDDPVESLLAQAAAFEPDLILVGAHGEPRLRDAMFGTTASHLARTAEQPVLLVQNDPARPCAKVLVAVEEEGAEEIVRLACTIAPARELFVVHAFGSVGESLFGYGNTIEKVRTDQQAMTRRVVASIAEAGADNAAICVHDVVEEGDVMEVIMNAWADFRPDLVVLGTHARSGLAMLLKGSVAQAAILGCPSDVAVTRV